MAHDRCRHTFSEGNADHTVTSYTQDTRFEVPTLSCPLFMKSFLPWYYRLNMVSYCRSVALVFPPRRYI